MFQDMADSPYFQNRDQIFACSGVFRYVDDELNTTFLCSWLFTLNCGTWNLNNVWSNVSGSENWILRSSTYQFPRRSIFADGNTRTSAAGTFPEKAGRTETCIWTTLRLFHPLRGVGRQTNKSR